MQDRKKKAPRAGQGRAARTTKQILAAHRRRMREEYREGYEFAEEMLRGRTLTGYVEVFKRFKELHGAGMYEARRSDGIGNAIVDVLGLVGSRGARR